MARILQIVHEAEKYIFCRLEVVGFLVGQAQKSQRIIVQPFSNISVMKNTDVDLPGIQPEFPKGFSTAFHPGDKKPVTYPIEEQKR
jgi:hypothetical protein